MGLLIGRNIGLGVMIKLNEESESITYLHNASLEVVLRDKIRRRD